MLRLKVALGEATVATSFPADSSDRQPSPSITKLTHMGMNTPGLTSTSATSIDTRKASQHYSWRSVKLSTPVLRAIQHVPASDNVAPATAHLGDGCRTTERLAVDRQPIPARLPTRLHLSDEEESALSNASTPMEAITTGDDGIGLKLAWSPTGQEVIIAIACGASVQRQHVPGLEGEETKSLCTFGSRDGGAQRLSLQN